MKKQASTILAMASLVLLLGASATSAGSIELRADIPFDFMVGNKMLPAGTYTVSRPADNTLQIRNQKVNHGIASVLAKIMGSAKTQGLTTLIFNRYGDRYFLSQVWTKGSANGYSVQKSSQEREFAKELAAKGVPGPEIVSVVATVE
jgi:hypothetical protein